MYFLAAPAQARRDDDRIRSDPDIPRLESRRPDRRLPDPARLARLPAARPDGRALPRRRHAPLLALGVVAVGVGLMLLSDTRSRRRTTAVLGLILLNVLPAAAIVAMAGTSDAREFLVWLVIPTLIAACTQNERLHLIQVGCAAAVALIVVASVGQALLAILLDLTVVIGVLVVLDVLARQLARSMAARIAELRRLSSSDGLTGALNRRGLISGFPGVVARAQRLGTPASACCWSTSTGSRTSTTASGTSRATSSCSGCARPSPAAWRRGTCSPGRAARRWSSWWPGPPSPWRRRSAPRWPRHRTPPRSPSASASSRPRPRTAARRSGCGTSSAPRTAGCTRRRTPAATASAAGTSTATDPPCRCPCPPVSRTPSAAARSRGAPTTSLFGWTLVVFDLAGLVALTIGRVDAGPAGHRRAGDAACSAASSSGCACWSSSRP